MVHAATAAVPEYPAAHDAETSNPIATFNERSSSSSTVYPVITLGLVHIISAQVVSDPFTSSPAALVFPAAHAVHVLLET